MVKNNDSTALLEPPTAPDPSAAPAPEPKAPFENDDLVTVVRKNWGTSGVPPTKTDYIDRVTFVGGVARNVPYDIARRWQKSGMVGVFILPNNASEEDFIRATGIQPMDDGRLAALIRSTDPTKLAALLSPAQLEKIAGIQQK